ncbi:MAG: TerB family tellurite resistance protein [Candidatus Pelagibacter sp.]
MLSFFSKNKNNESDKSSLHIKTAALLIHTAKIDENYSDKEKKIIKTALINLGVNEENFENIFKKAEDIEANSNQILEFTKEIKNSDESFKIKIIETLWSIIYSDNNLDMYESNFMRRLTGLLYLDNKIVGNIKEKIKKKFNK